MGVSKIIIFDVDGVLTDGKFWIDSHGERSKGFNTRDIRGLRELIAKGYQVYLITASSWSGMESFAEKTGVEIKVLRDKSEFKIDEPFICIVDDAWDIPLIKNASQSYCPSDANEFIKQKPGVQILKTKGGEGVAAEMAMIL